MIYIGIEIDTFPPRAIVPPQCWNWHKKAHGFGHGRRKKRPAHHDLSHRIGVPGAHLGGGLPRQSAWWPLIGPTPRWRGHTRSAARVNPGLRAAAVAAGLGDGYSGHSGRVGMAQALAADGAGLPELMEAGRWGIADHASAVH